MARKVSRQHALLEIVARCEHRILAAGGQIPRPAAWANTLEARALQLLEEAERQEEFRAGRRLRAV